MGSHTSRFAQVDVFSDVAAGGNPLAVVVDAEGLTDAQMAAFARWTNLSETTFLLPAEDPGADYRVRIFTPGGELPFAGHPTLGSCSAWLAAGGKAKTPGIVVQECGVGLVNVRIDREHPGRLAFAAPPLMRDDDASGEELARHCIALGLEPAQVLQAQWIDNGPGWLGILLDSPATVLGLTPDPVAMQGLKVGVCALGGPTPGDAADLTVRAFFSEGQGYSEDPVTGSLNAGLAQWLVPHGVLPDVYVASQGTAMGRDGRVHVVRDGETLWIGGDVTAVITGEVTL